LLCRYLLEHGLKADGRPDPEAKDAAEGGSFETFFTETGSGKYVPRSIFVDLDPSVRIFMLGDSLKGDTLIILCSQLTRSGREHIANSSIPSSSSVARKMLLTTVGIEEEWPNTK
jgi:tubulin alpha